MPKKAKSYVYKPIEGDRGTIRRNWAIRDGSLLSAKDGEFQTLYDIYQNAKENFSNNKYMGVRKLNPDGSAGAYEYMTVREVADQVELVKGALAQLGVAPKQHVGLYGKNKPEWLFADYACQSRSNCTVPLYDTLGPDAAAYVIDHAECIAIFCDYNVLNNAVEGAVKAGRVLGVIAFPLQAFEDLPEIQKAYNDAIESAKGKGVKVFSWKEFLAMSKPTSDHPPKPDDLCTICYTSGTTGTPKGAMLTHHNIVTDAVALLKTVDFKEEDSGMSYLPLAHMFERTIQVMSLMKGASTNFYRGDTLLLLEDIGEAKPTVFIGVPRLYNKIYDKIIAQVDESGVVKRSLFWWVYERKKSYLETGSYTSMFDFVFAKVRDALGGRVRLLCTGSAPISDKVMDFLRICFSAPVTEGYGQTESTCAATLTVDEHVGGGHVGVPLECNEITLMSVPEMNYNVTDVVDGKRVERGEICFRGGNIFQGYWKQAEKTAETIDKQGWLHSGDIGMWLPDGNLKIIDRKKNIFKLSQGEYVAPEKIENIYVQSKWVAQNFVYGNSLERHLVGIVIPDEEVLEVHCRANNISGSFSDWCKNDSIKQMIIKDMEAKAVANKLQGFERVKAVYLHDELFSPENGLLTPTFKLKRPVVTKKFQSVIDALYQEASGGKLRSKL